MTPANPPLEQAPPAVKLAVDLIMLLEQHQLDPATVLAALAIVNKDFQRKLQQQAQQ
jgi:hypothetical protein